MYPNKTTKKQQLCFDKCVIGVELVREGSKGIAAVAQADHKTRSQIHEQLSCAITYTYTANTNLRKSKKKWGSGIAGILTCWALATIRSLCKLRWWILCACQ